MTMFGNGTRPRGRWRRLTAGTVAVTSGLLAAGAIFAASASAHVKVSGVDAVQGGAGLITFRVPSESDTASTTGLLVTFPAATPFTEVDVQPMAGWKARVIKKPLPKPLKDDDGDTITEYVAQVDYTADSKATGIPAGEFDLFNLSVGPFPAAPSMSFSALQTYSDGTTVNWDEQSANGTEPDHPAPVLDLTAAASAASQPTVTASAPPQASASSGGGSSWTGITGLVAGLLALVISIAVAVANRSRGKSESSV